jgi:chromosome segregation ATPase
MNRALAIALAVALLAAGVQTWRLESERADHADTRAAHAKQIAALAETARQAEADARTEEQRRTAEVQKAANEADQSRRAAEADAAAARDAGERLRARLAAITASCRAARVDPGAADAGASADATARVLADVQRRLDEAADGIARFADQSHGAGSACEKSYDALRRE